MALATSLPVSASSPQARGDDPISYERVGIGREFSPTRGDGPRSSPAHDNANVSPCALGMVRNYSHRTARGFRSPHGALGWSDLDLIVDLPFEVSPRAWRGPVVNGSTVSLSTFSPGAWGWYRRRCADHEPGHVLPTRVGMVRSATSDIMKSIRSPHAVGMVRVVRSSIGRVREFPHAVGMVRRACRGPATVECSPQARGDGPERR